MTTTTITSDYDDDAEYDDYDGYDYDDYDDRYDDDRDGYRNAYGGARPPGREDGPGPGSWDDLTVPSPEGGIPHAS